MQTLALLNGLDVEISLSNSCGQVQFIYNFEYNGADCGNIFNLVKIASTDDFEMIADPCPNTPITSFRQSTNRETTVYNYRIYNIQGTEVSNQTSTLLNTSELTNGFYVVKVYLNNQLILSKNIMK